MSETNKASLCETLLGVLVAERDAVVEAQQATAAGATHEQTKADSDKDTRAIEASYLARGQAERARSLREDVERVRSMTLRDFGPADPIALSALVTLVLNDETTKNVFLAPAGGGVTLGASQVQVVTPASPLGRALLGATEGDAVEFRRGSRVEIIDIEGVR